MHNGVGQHTNATQTSRAIATLYALLGDIDRQGGNVVFPKAPANVVSGKEFLPKEMAEQRIGRERKPLGPPAKPGNCAAYDIFTAILDGRPYPVKALLNFGSNTIMNTGDSQRAREAFRALDFAVAAEFFMTPTAALCDYVLPAASFLEKSNMAPMTRLPISSLLMPILPLSAGFKRSSKLFGTSAFGIAFLLYPIPA